MNVFGWDVVQIERSEMESWHRPGKEGMGPEVLFEARRAGTVLYVEVAQDARDLETWVNVASVRPLTSNLSELAKRKSDTWRLCRGEQDRVYTPLAFTYWDADRLREQYVNRLDEVSSMSPGFQDFCDEYGVQLVRHDDVFAGHSPPCWTGKLCAVVKADDFEKMVALLIGQKVVPLSLA